MEDAEKVEYHLKFIKGLINGKPKKSSKDKDTVAVSKGNWTTCAENEIAISGIDVDGSYQITWVDKNNKRISKEESKVNFSYVAALNPVMITLIIQEYERLKNYEKEYKACLPKNDLSL